MVPHIFLTPELRRWRQADLYKFEASLIYIEFSKGYIVRAYLYQTTKTYPQIKQRNENNTMTSSVLQAYLEGRER